MNGFSRLPALLLVMTLLLVSAPAAWAREMVSSAVRTLNLRSGPGVGNPAHWTVTRGYPFQVLQRKGDWLQVRDFEGDRAWVYRSMTNKVPHRVVKAQVANLRRAPGARSPIVKKAGYGDVLRTLEKRGKWTKVRHEGGAVGWVATSLTWGW